MEDKQTIVIAGVLLCILIIGAVLRLGMREAEPGVNPKVTTENAMKLQIGMSMDEVKEILGTPWSVNQGNGEREELRLRDAVVDSIYEWADGSDKGGGREKVGFAKGSVVAIDVSA